METSPVARPSASPPPPVTAPLMKETAAPLPTDVVQLQGKQPPAPTTSCWRKIVNGVELGLQGVWIASPLLLPVMVRGLDRALSYPFQSARKRREEPAVVQWLQTEAPFKLQQSVGRAVKVLSSGVEKSVGLSLSQFLEAESALQRMMSTKDFLANMAYPAARYDLLDFYRRSGEPDLVRHYLEDLKGYNTAGAFVYLGEDRKKEADRLKLDFDKSFQPHTENPYRGQQLEPVWDSLAEQARSGRMPVFVDLDGDVRHESVSESIVAATIASLGQRRNSFGKEASDSASYFPQRYLQHSWYKAGLEPWLQRTQPRLAEAADDIKQDLAPLTPSRLHRLTARLTRQTPLTPLYWEADQSKVTAALDTFMRATSWDGRPPATLKNQCAFADLAMTLDQDLNTGIQSHWIRFLKELGADRRAPLLESLAKSWVALNLSEDEAVVPKDAPGMDPYWKQGHDGAELRSLPYDRALALGAVVEHTINGLGISERRQFMDTLGKEIAARGADLLTRDAAVRVDLPPHYRMRTLDYLWRNPSPERSDYEALGLLQSEARLVGQKENLQGDELRRYTRLSRHYDMLQWLVNRGTRYGEAVSQLFPDTLQALGGSLDGSIPARLPAANLFQGTAFGIGEFYQASPTTGKPTPMRAGPSHVEWLGEGAAQTLLSVVLKGGGGKGFAYVECLRQMKAALAASKDGRFGINEYVGTSAGAITAGLLAAGFKTDEVEAVMRELDFKQFFSDYIWKQGGVDPKARGINRDGLFSTQEMYRTLYGVLSKKLGIEGRPILFRDLPFKLKVVTTVLDTDLPQDHPLRRQIGGDSELVFSDEKTPNVDVVAAMVASSSIPAFFDSPQIQVADRPGQVSTPHRVQLMDGGVVNNFPVAAASRSSDGKTGLVVLPVDYGGLSTLDFGPTEAVLADANGRNAKQYGRFTPGLVSTMNRARQEHGYDHFVIGLNLAHPEDQALPLLLGTSPEESRTLRSVAATFSMPCLSSEDANKVMDKNLPDSSFATTVKRGVLKWLLDSGNVIRGARYEVPVAEAESLRHVMLGAGAASLLAGKYRNSKSFEVSA